MKLKFPKKIISAIAYGNYLVFWINVAGILFLAINYQKLFEYLGSALTGLISLAASIALLLTGKKHFDLKVNKFTEVFSSPKTWIPNLLFLLAIAYVTSGVLNPAQQRIKIDFNKEWQVEMFTEEVPVRGRAELHAVNGNSDNLVGVCSFNRNIEFDFLPVDSAQQLYVKLNLENKLERLWIKNNTLQIPVKFNFFPDTCYLKLNSKEVKIDAPPHITKIQFIDKSDFGRYKTLTVNNGGDTTIIFGLYKYILRDSLGNERFSGNITVNNDISNEKIRLPLESTDVNIVVNGGTLRVIGGKYLGIVEVRNAKKLRLLNDKSYDYTLNSKYYYTRNGNFSVKDMEMNGSIKFNPGERKKSWVKFDASLPDGEEVPAEVFIENKYYGISTNPLSIEARFYNNIRLTYTDSISTIGKKFKYEYENKNYDISADSYEFPVKLELK